MRTEFDGVLHCDSCCSSIFVCMGGNCYAIVHYELYLLWLSFLYFIYLGFLLRELKDYWHVALLISTILHPIDIKDEPSQLGKRRDLFNTVENSIIKLGELSGSFVNFCL